MLVYHPSSVKGKAVNRQSLRLDKVAKAVEAQLVGDGAVIIRGIGPIEDAKEGDLSFVAHTY